MKIITTLVFLFFIGTSESSACSCIPHSIKEAFAISESIFQGKVISKEFVSIEHTMDEEKLVALRKKLKSNDQKLAHLKSSSIIKVTVELSEVYKGKLGCGNITLFTTRSGASCGYTSFEIGTEFLIYASTSSLVYWIFESATKNIGKLERENTFWTNQCTRTTEYNEQEANELSRLSNN